MSDLESDVGSEISSSDDDEVLIYGNPRTKNNNFFGSDHIMGHKTASFRDVADRFNITISSLYRIIRRVIFCLSNMSPVIITWPTDEEKPVSEDYFRAHGFPRVIGSIDGSHIRIDKPNDDNDSYINRKSYYSIQMQAVCDHRKKIIDLFVGYPGSVHDSRVFRNPSFYRTMEEKCGNYFILADSGYPLTTHVLTPFRDRGQLNDRQLNYNIKLCRNRYVIEHCCGMLKQKFRQLYHIKIRDIRFIVHMIRASCVLHNIALDDGIDWQEDIPALVPVYQVNEDEVGDNINDEDDRNAQDIRRMIVEMLPM
ncbi:putative nuclease HARBI1 [Anoplophora glabripennis]|uniref:putative nuclease HARBI1 n=1 Tax=Anoplophora glabripennis TaxID=217634 RepID=UPI000C78E2D2|nr:putative nuclease HARBI1 [Anoplophora glabripennis]